MAAIFESASSLPAKLNSHFDSRFGPRPPIAVDPKIEYSVDEKYSNRAK
jgi:hypothetical protein